jgi:hypothetical protein
MKNKLIPIISSVFVLFFLVLCSAPEEETNNSSTQTKTSNDTLSGDEAMVYSLPSPVQAPALIKLLGLRYNEKLLHDTRNSKLLNFTSTYKAVFLGMAIVDMGYATVFDKHQQALNYVRTIDDLTHELGMKTPKSINSFDDLQRKIANKDSLSTLTRDFVQLIEERFTNCGDEKTLYLVMTGMQFESLYLINHSTVGMEKVLKKSMFAKSALHNAYLQQGVFLDNLIELLSSCEGDEIKPLLAEMQHLAGNFDELGISYSLNKSATRIDRISLKNDKFPQLKTHLDTLRHKIIFRGSC